MGSYFLNTHLQQQPRISYQRSFSIRTVDQHRRKSGPEIPPSHQHWDSNYEMATGRDWSSIEHARHSHHSWARRSSTQKYELQITAQFYDQRTVWGAHAVHETKVLKALEAINKLLTSKAAFPTPHYISHLGLGYRMNDDWRLGMQPREQSAYYIDTANEAGNWCALSLLDANVSYCFSVSNSTDPQGNNLVKREYEYLRRENSSCKSEKEPRYLMAWLSSEQTTNTPYDYPQILHASLSALTSYRA